MNAQHYPRAARGLLGALPCAPLRMGAYVCMRASPCLWPTCLRPYGSRAASPRVHLASRTAGRLLAAALPNVSCSPTPPDVCRARSSRVFDRRPTAIREHFARWRAVRSSPTMLQRAQGRAGQPAVRTMQHHGPADSDPPRHLDSRFLEATKIRRLP